MPTAKFSANSIVHAMLYLSGPLLCVADSLKSCVITYHGNADYITKQLILNVT
jgi:hypothetical protein